MNDVSAPNRSPLFLRTTPARMASAWVILAFAPVAFAQSSAPVTSSVLMHPATDDTGGESGAINDNWKFIMSPPARPVAASAPAQSNGAHRGGRHGRGAAASGGAGDTGATSAGISSGTSTGMPTGISPGAPAGLQPPAIPAAGTPVGSAVNPQ